MTVRRLSAVDAQMHWMSAKIPNDQFLLYGFAGVASDLEQALASVLARVSGCPELRLRVRDRGPFTYPSWIAGEVRPDQVVLHDLTDSSWAGCLAAVARLAEHQLDARRMTWRLHVFTPVDGPPGTGVGTVAVLQLPLHEGWAGHTVGDLEEHIGARIAFIVRFGTGVLPNHNTVVQADDQVYAAAISGTVTDVTTAAATVPLND